MSFKEDLMISLTCFFPINLGTVMLCDEINSNICQNEIFLVSSAWKCCRPLVSGEEGTVSEEISLLQCTL